MANLTTTTSARSVEAGASAEAGVGIAIDPAVSTSSMQSLNEISEHILKLCTAAQTTAVAATALTAASTASSATVTQDSSFLPLQVPVVGANGCYTAQSSGTPLISPQLQSLLALQYVTSQLPLTESYRLPILTNLSSHIASDIRWKPVYETQSSALSSIPVVDSNNKSTTDMRQHVVVTDGNFSNKGAPISSVNNSDIPICTTSKTGIVFQ